MRNKKFKVLDLTIVRTENMVGIYIDDKLFFTDSSIDIHQLGNLLNGQAFRIIKSMYEDPDVEGSSYELAAFPNELSEIKETPKYTRIYKNQDGK